MKLMFWHIFKRNLFAQSLRCTRQLIRSVYIAVVIWAVRGASAGLRPFFVGRKPNKLPLGQFLFFDSRSILVCTLLLEHQVGPAKYKWTTRRPIGHSLPFTQLALRSATANEAEMIAST